MFKLPDLPYGYDALQPILSAETMHLHHDKHHAKYFSTLNDILAGQPHAGSLEEVVVKAAADGEKKLFNNAAQAWNHTFFWACMSPRLGGEPEDELAAAIDKTFGGLGGLMSQFIEEGAGHFGSGWVWLAASGDSLKLVATHDGENLLTQKGLVPLLTCDLWEHAYYIDYQNQREVFLEAWFTALPNWTLAAEQFAASASGKPGWRHP